LIWLNSPVAKVEHKDCQTSRLSASDIRGTFRFRQSEGRKESCILDMKKEIERKFLVREGAWTPGDAGVRYLRGYLSTAPERVVRVRIAGEDATLTIKGAPSGLARDEFEYPIPLADAERILKELCPHPLIEKTRYRVAVRSHIWEVDVFHGVNEGLVVAELEVADEGESFTRPPWIDREVSGDVRYSNTNLSIRPFNRWATRMS
jgi:adenylate cyclase